MLRSSVILFVLLCAGSALGSLIPLSHDAFDNLVRKTGRRDMVNTTAVVSGECKRLFSRSNEVVISWVSCGSFSEPSVFYDENCGANSQFLVTCAGDCLISISGGAGDGVDWGCSTVGGSRSHYHVVTSQVNCLYENHACEATTSGTFFGFGPENGVGQLRDSTACDCHTDCVVSSPIAFPAFCSGSGTHSMEFSRADGDLLKIDASLLPSLSSNDWTIEFWVTHDGTVDADFFSMYGGVGNDLYPLHIHDQHGRITGIFAGHNSNNVLGRHYLTTDASFNFDHFQHIAITRAGSSITFYVNGVSYSTTASGNALGTLIPTVGADSFIGNINGKIDNLRLWNVAKTQAQVVAGMDTLFGDNIPAELVFCAEFEGDAVAATQTCSGDALIVEGTPTQSTDVPF